MLTALAKGNKWDDFPENEEDAIDFGDPRHNFSYTIICMYRLDDSKPLSFENNQMYNAINNIPIEKFYNYIMSTRFELPCVNDVDDLEFFIKMIKKYNDNELTFKGRYDNIMTKLEAIKFIQSHTSNTKFHKFLKTGKFENDEDI